MNNEIVLLRRIEELEKLIMREPEVMGGGSGGGTDENAIHDNVSGEIAAITEKTSIADNDLILIEDSANSNNKKRVLLSRLKAAYAALFAPIAHVGATGSAHGNATTGVAGFMSAADKTKLNGIVITGAMAYRTTNLSVADATWTTLSFAAEYFDYYPSGLSEMWASGTPGRITIRVAGIYHIKAYGRFAANATGYRGIRISKNETEILRDFKANISATYDIPMNLSHVALLAASDYIQADVWQNCGGALDFINPFWLSVVKQN